MIRGDIKKRRFRPDGVRKKSSQSDEAFKRAVRIRYSPRSREYLKEKIGEIEKIFDILKNKRETSKERTAHE